MKKLDKNSRAKFWTKITASAWARREPPYKPSKGEINFWEKLIKKFVKNKKNFRVLILGATPEFRDMLAKYQVDVFLLDINPKMKKAMDRLLKTKPKKEKFLAGDWLNMPFADSYFDVVMGDTPQHNVKRYQHFILFRQIKRVLKPSGYLFLSSWFFNRASGMTLNEFFSLYQKDPKFFHSFKNRTYALCMVGKKEFYNKKTWEWSWAKVDKKITNEFRKRNLPAKDLDSLLFNYGNYTQVCPFEPKFSEFLKRYFRIEKTWQDKSHIVMNFKKDFALKKCSKIKRSY